MSDTFKTYEVRVVLQQGSDFNVMIEAEDEADALAAANDNVWNDKYTQEIRASLTIDDENYYAEEVIETHFCPICENVHEHGTQAAMNVQAFVDSDKVIHTP